MWMLNVCWWQGLAWGSPKGDLSPPAPQAFILFCKTFRQKWWERKIITTKYNSFTHPPIFHSALEFDDFPKSCMMNPLNLKQITWKQPGRLEMRMGLVVCICWAIGVSAIPNFVLQKYLFLNSLFIGISIISTYGYCSKVSTINIFSRYTYILSRKWGGWWRGICRMGIPP